MFTQANSLVAVVGDVVVVSLLLSAAALVAMMLAEWGVPTTGQCCGGDAQDISIFGPSPANADADRTGARGSQPRLTLIPGGRPDGQDLGPARGQLTLVHVRQRSSAAAAGAPASAAETSPVALLPKTAHR